MPAEVSLPLNRAELLFLVSQLLVVPNDLSFLPLLAAFSNLTVIHCNLQGFFPVFLLFVFPQIFEFIFLVVTVIICSHLYGITEFQTISQIVKIALSSVYQTAVSPSLV